MTRLTESAMDAWINLSEGMDEICNIANAPASENRLTETRKKA